MPRYMKRTALALCAAASLAAAGTTPTHHSRTVLLDCAGEPRTRPADYVLACGDGNSRLTALHWSRWTSAEAEGRGLNAVNDCVPYCAAGTFHSYPVRVRLDTPSAGKVRHYTRVTLTFTAGKPDKAARTATYRLPEAPPGVRG